MTLQDNSLPPAPASPATGTHVVGRIERKLVYAFGVGVLALAAMAVVSYRNLVDGIESGNWVRHTMEVLAVVVDVQRDLTETQAAERGYLLTGDSTFLGRYERARTTALDDVATLSRLVADNPAQTSTLTGLRVAIANNFRVWDENLRRYRTDSIAVAIATVRGGAGERALNESRSVLEVMGDRERALLEHRQRQRESSFHQALVVLGLGFALALGVALLAMVSVARDLRERDAIAAELAVALEGARAANQAKSAFLARMSHELRTPLNSVIGFANVLLKNRRDALDAQELSFVERIRSNGSHLLEVINDILDLSKVESGRMELEISAVDVPAMITELTSQLAVHDGVVLETRMPARVAPLHTDGQKLRQVLLNLLSNAVKFTEKGHVVVTVRTDGVSHRVRRIDVTDQGIGIAPNRIGAIFDAFEQAEVSTSRTHGGTGLGLAIVRSFLERLGYRVAVDSVPGRGSTFSVLVDPDEPPPVHLAMLADATVAKPRVAAPAASASTDRLDWCPTVLVIDDNADSRLLINQFVDDAGCQALVAMDGEQGLQMARDYRPDLITLDLKMPGLDGWQVLRRLKADPDTANIPVIVVSIVAGDDRSRLIGAVDLVEKPIVRDNLVNAIRRNLKRGTTRVLVVEDDPDARALIAESLRDFPGLELRTAPNGEAALEALDDFQPDLFLLDLMLPGMSGGELLGRLRDDPRFVATPIVVATAKTLEPAERRALERDAAAVLAKGDDFAARLALVFRRLAPEVSSASHRS